MKVWNMHNQADREEAINFAVKEGQLSILRIIKQKMEEELISMPVNRDDRFWNGGMNRAIQMIQTMTEIASDGKYDIFKKESQDV